MVLPISNREKIEKTAASQGTRGIGTIATFVGRLSVWIALFIFAVGAGACFATPPALVLQSARQPASQLDSSALARASARRPRLRSICRRCLRQALLCCSAACDRFTSILTRCGAPTRSSFRSLRPAAIIAARKRSACPIWRELRSRRPEKFLRIPGATIVRMAPCSTRFAPCTTAAKQRARAL